MSNDRKPWPRLFTCPAGDDDALKADDLGVTVFNPTFSNKTKMQEEPEACDGCDYREAGECSGPVEYAPVVPRRKCERCPEFFQPLGGERTCPACSAAQRD